MAKNVRPQDFGVELSRLMDEYSLDVSEAVDAELEITAKKIKADAAKNAPRKTGEYAKGFAIKKSKENGAVKRIIHNKKKPGLTHVLEFGHLKRGGKGRVNGIPHLRPAFDKHTMGLDSKLEQIIKKVGE